MSVLLRDVIDAAGLDLPDFVSGLSADRRWSVYCHGVFHGVPLVLLAGPRINDCARSRGDHIQNMLYVKKVLTSPNSAPTNRLPCAERSDDDDQSRWKQLQRPLRQGARALWAQGGRGRRDPHPGRRAARI